MRNQIEERRKALGLTQKDFADRLGVSRQTIISLERGKYNPTLILAHKIAVLFECTIEDIFLFDEEV